MLMTAALLALAVPSAPDPRAAEAVKLFASLCASARGMRGIAMARLGQGNGMGRLLDADDLARLQGEPGGMGWALTSPAGAALVLDFASGGRCGVRVVDAEPRALREAFDAAAALLAQGFGSTLTSSGQGYTYHVRGRTVQLVLATSDGPAPEHRHRMTFAYLD